MEEVTNQEGAVSTSRGGQANELGLAPGLMHLPHSRSAHRRNSQHPYLSNRDLPDDIQQALPFSLQTLYREAYNKAWNGYVMPLRRGFMVRHDEAAKRAAWALIKRKYVQTGSDCVRR